MERRVRGNSHARCGVGENPEIASKDYLSLLPGSFSSAGGEDFRIVLEEIIRIKDGSCSVPRPDSGRWESAGAIILGDQFSLAWRVLDAQFWGVAQRRKRIFLVADFAGRSAIQILFEQDRLLRDSAPGRSQRQRTSAPAQGGAAPPGGTAPIGFDGYNGDLTGKKAGHPRRKLRDVHRAERCNHCLCRQSAGRGAGSTRCRRGAGRPAWDETADLCGRNHGQRQRRLLSL